MRNALRAKAASLLVAIAWMGFASAARAEPSDYVFTPIVEPGEREIDFKFGTGKARDGTRSSASSLGLGYGVNSFWFTEAYAKANRQTPDGWRFDAFEWENKFQLTEAGKYPVDAGLIVELERPRDRSEGWELKWGPLFQADLTQTIQANFNVLLQRHYRSETPSSLELGYQWQLKYRWIRELEVGAQGFGSVGPWRQWLPRDEQFHNAGPAVFGKIRLNDGRKVLAYNAAWLIGANSATPRNTLRLQVEYEF